MAGLTDLVHSLFVLLTTFSYALPAWEGVQRRSFHHAAIFAAQGVLAFVLHCEETGLCAPLKAAVHQSLTRMSAVLANYVLFVMLGVVFELRSEQLLRAVGATSSLLLAWLGGTAGPSSVTPMNALLSIAITLAVLAVDVQLFARRFTPAYWKRLTVIGGMAALGLGLLRLLSVLWLWHGISHLFNICCCYLLLLAQRHKKQGKKPNGGQGGSYGSGRAGASPGSGARSRTGGAADSGQAPNVEEGERGRGAAIAGGMASGVV
jgi:hypothetical protein